ncbi:hypothetical protein FB567DRAFT_607020 [Paraphoma chrysanthemicola]|uniref:Uncharacterized protein n=1 Tax=Paraphoma chrysanthemicola TaxID=798071 RepID=A0A8K0QYD9_9PLEO|nr:hypothetical protein FB567DRAFT_607020 [Paraphoma chrysanthemicola]
MDTPYQQDPRLQQQQQRLLQQQRQRAGMANTQFSPQSPLQLPQTFNGADTAAAAPQGQSVGHAGTWAQPQHYPQYQFQSYPAQSVSPNSIPATQARQMGNGAAPFAPQRQGNGVGVARMYPQQYQQNATGRSPPQLNTARSVPATQARQAGNDAGVVAPHRQDGGNLGVCVMARERMRTGVARTPSQTDMARVGSGTQGQQVVNGAAPFASARQYGIEGRARAGSQQYPQNGVGRPSQPSTTRSVPTTQSPQAINGASPSRQNTAKEVPQLSSPHYQNRPGPQNQVRLHPPQPSPRLPEKRKDAPTAPFHPPKRREIIDLTRTNSPAPSHPMRPEPNHGFGPTTIVFPSSTPPSRSAKPQTQDHQQTAITPALIHSNAIHHGVNPLVLEFGTNIHRMINARLMHYAELSGAKSLLDPSPAVLARLLAERHREDAECKDRDADSTGSVCEFGYVPERLTAAAKAKVKSGEFDLGWSCGDKEKLVPLGKGVLEGLGCVREEEEGVWRPMEEVGISEERAGVLWGLEWVGRALDGDGSEDGDEVEENGE